MPLETPPEKREGLRQPADPDPRPLAWPAFRRMLLGQGTSYIGTTVTAVAVPVQVYAISRSSLHVGLTGLAGLAPTVVFGLYGGVIADAYDRRRPRLHPGHAAGGRRAPLLAVPNGGT